MVCVFYCDVFFDDERKNEKWFMLAPSFQVLAWFFIVVAASLCLYCNLAFVVLFATLMNFF